MGFVLASTVFLLSCSGAEGTGPQEPVVTSITVSVPRPMIRVGETIQASASVLGASSSVISGKTVSWSTDNSSIASITAAGAVTAAAAGTVRISASSDGKSGDASLLVTIVPITSVTVNPASSTVPVGQAITLTAAARDSSGKILQGRPVSWVSSDVARGSVSSLGVVVGLAPGTVDIIASADGIVGSARIDVTPVVSAVPVASVTISIPRTSFRVGESLQAGALALDSLGGALTGRTVVWDSPTPEIVTVSPGGLVTAVNSGVGTIAATIEGRRASINLLLSLVPVATVTVTPIAPAISAGASLSLTVVLKDSADRVLSGRTISWSSNASSVASVNSSGVLSALLVGQAQIIATAEGKSGSTTVTVNTLNTAVATVSLQAASTIITGGGKKQITPTLRDANGNVLGGRTIAWSSSNPDRATVSGTGEVTASAVDGPVTITATVEGRIGTITLDILTFVRLAAGNQFACGLITDGTAYCWGVLGSGSIANPLVTVPTKIGGEQRFSTISAGGGHVCALSTTSGTYCWGGNTMGQLGNGTTVGSAVPIRVIGGHDFVSIAAGATSTCATTAVLDVYCWGQIIRPRDLRYPFDEGSRRSIVEPEKTGTGIVAVVGGGRGPIDDWGTGDQYCGVGSTGLPYCWSRRLSNQIGRAHV